MSAPDDLIDDEEGDLFGSEEEGEAPPTVAKDANASTASATDAGLPTDSAAKDVDEDNFSEKDLFGSEEEGEEFDEKELFGSDDEAAAKAPADARKSPLPPPSEISEMDERDIFGDVSSDEEVQKVEDVVLTRRPAPPTDRVFVPLRLPNVLSAEKTPFKPDAIPQSLLEGYKEFKNTRGQNVVKLMNPENCIRWRFRKGPDGQILTDDIGRPQYESNSRIVEWEDGSRTLFVGAESFNLSEIEDRTLLYEENSQDVYVCHGIISKRLVATPRSLDSSTHEMLKRSQYRKYEPVRRSVLMSAEEQAESRQLLELEREEKKRLELKQKSRHEEPGLSTAFLEDDDAGVGVSLADIKRQHQPLHRPVKRPKTDGDDSP